MKTEKQTTGQRGEEEACRYLQGLGQTVMARNWRSGHLELDIVTFDGKGVHFVEVKTRTAPVMAEPEANVNRAKRQRMVRAAGSWLAESGKMGLGDVEAFFDVVSVVLDGDEVNIEYYPEAFIPIYV